MKGYIAERYYLLLAEESEPCIAKSCINTKNATDIFDEKIEEIIQRAEALGFKQQKLDEKEQQLTKKEKSLNEREKTLKEKKYSFYCEVLRSGHCKEECVKTMGQELWDENLDCAISAGGDIGKSEHKVKQEVSYAMVSIYEDLQLYDKAYDFLVEQAIGCSWINLHTVQNIVKKVGYCSRLKSAVCERLRKNGLSTNASKDFEETQNWITFDFEL